LTVQQQLGFQWGHCCHSHGCGVADYAVGDLIQWRRAMDGSVPPWVYFKGHNSANIGDPQYANLIVRELEFDTRVCGNCNVPFGGFAISISAGVIASAGTSFGIPDNVDIVLVNPNGSLTPMPEWNDHAMPDVVRGAFFRRYVTHADF
jgi:hypothetical protein